MDTLQAYLLGTSIADARDLGALEGENLRLHRELQQTLENLRVARASAVGFRALMQALQAAHMNGDIAELNRLVFDDKYKQRLFDKAYYEQYRLNEPLRRV